MVIVIEDFGGIKWIRGLLPLSEAKARKLETCESVLKEFLAKVSPCQPAIQMLEAIRAEALGDKHALLALPLELRRLVKPAGDGKG